MRTTPNLRRMDRLHIEPSHNAKVAATTLQRPEQIRVVLLVGLDQRAVRQHNLIVDHAVAGPTDLVPVEADTTGQEKTGDTDGADTTTGDGQAVGFEVVVYIGPAGVVSMHLCRCEMRISREDN